MNTLYLTHITENIYYRNGLYIFISGNYSLRALSTPLLYDVIFSATKKVSKIYNTTMYSYI